MHVRTVPLEVQRHFILNTHEQATAVHPDRGECVHHRSNVANDTMIQEIKTYFGQSAAPLSKCLILAAEASEAALMPPAAIVRVSLTSCAVSIMISKQDVTAASVEHSA